MPSGVFLGDAVVKSLLVASLLISSVLTSSVLTNAVGIGIGIGIESPIVSRVVDVIPPAAQALGGFLGQRCQALSEVIVVVVQTVANAVALGTEKLPQGTLLQGFVDAWLKIGAYITAWNQRLWIGQGGGVSASSRLAGVALCSFRRLRLRWAWHSGVPGSVHTITGDIFRLVASRNAGRRAGPNGSLRLIHGR
ncbi:MAG: hypothetical protein VYD49_02620 [Pseudomonadota bacterium]|nr:hypothetical protein [Pseudomonadota bacterium]